MDAVQPILPFLGWIVLGIVTGIGAIMIHMVQNFLDDMADWRKETDKTLDNHEIRIVKLEN